MEANSEGLKISIQFILTMLFFSYFSQPQHSPHSFLSHLFSSLFKHSSLSLSLFRALSPSFKNLFPSLYFPIYPFPSLVSPFSFFLSFPSPCLFLLLLHSWFFTPFPLRSLLLLLLLLIPTPLPLHSILSSFLRLHPCVCLAQGKEGGNGEREE